MYRKALVRIAIRGVYYAYNTYDLEEKNAFFPFALA